MINGVTVSENLRGQAIRPLRRRRDSGDERRHGGHLGGVRALRRRRRQRHHQVRRQSLQRIVPRHAEQRQLADADAVRAQRKSPPIQPTRSCASTRPSRPTNTRWADPSRRTISGSSPPAGCRRRRAADRSSPQICPIPTPTKRGASKGKGPSRSTPTTRSREPTRKIIENQTNDTFNTSASMDLRSLDNRQLPEDLFTASYNGILSPISRSKGRVSSRHFSFIGSGAPTTDLIQGTLLLDTQRGNTRFWSPTFCGVCDPEKRDNTDVFAKAHLLPVDQRHAARTTWSSATTSSTTSGSPTTISPGATTASLRPPRSSRGQDVIPQFLGDGTTVIQWNPIPDRQPGDELPDALGVRERQLAREQPPDGERRAALRPESRRRQRRASRRRTTARSAHASASSGIRPGRSAWAISASFAKYVSAISNSVADSSSAAGNPQTFRFVYRGPSINANGPTTATPRCHCGGLQLVQRQRRRQPAAVGRANHSRPHPGHPGIAGLAQQPGIRRPASAGASATSPPSEPISCIATSGTSTSRAGYQHRQGPGSVRQVVRPRP